MTRDEAIQKLQQGKKITHCSWENNFFIFLSTDEYGSKECRWEQDNKTGYTTKIDYHQWLFNEKYNDGWSVQKIKTKKTFYQAIEIYEGQPNQTSALYTTYEECRKQWKNWQIVSFELEIEE